MTEGPATAVAGPSVISVGTTTPRMTDLRHKS